MSEDNVISGLINLHKNWKRRKGKMESARSSLEQYARIYSEEHEDLQHIERSIRKTENSIKAVWGEDALKLAKQKVKESQDED